MISELKRSVALLLAIALPMKSLAATTCWTHDQVRAAEVNDFYTIAMTGALLCRSEDAAIWPRYVAFLVGKRAALGQSNAMLRRHFVASRGAASARSALDSYATKVGNRYGAGVTGFGCSDIASLIEAGIAAPPTIAALANLAEQSPSDPLLDAPRCDGSVAPMRVAKSTTPTHLAAKAAFVTTGTGKPITMPTAVPRLEVAIEAIDHAPMPLATAFSAPAVVLAPVSVASLAPRRARQSQ